MSTVAVYNEQSTYKREWLDYFVLGCAFFLILHTFNGPGGDSTLDYGATAGTGSIGKQAGFLLLLTYGLVSLLLEQREVFRFKTASAVLSTSFVSLIILSIAWSVDVKSSVTRVFGFLVYVLSAAGTVKRLGWKGILKFYVVMQLSYLLIGVMNELRLNTFHPFAGGYRFSGTADDNATGNDAVVLLFASVAMWRSAPAERLSKWSLGVAIIILLLTKSRTAILSATFALLLSYGLVAFRGLRLGAYLYGIALFGGALFVSQELHLFSLQNAVSLGREDATSNEALNGRTPLWIELYDDYVDRSPLIGYGYGAFWTPKKITQISEDQGWPIAAAHSIYLDALLALGYLGASLYVLTLISLLIRAVTLARRGRLEGYFFTCILCAIIFDGLTDSEPWYVSSIYLFAAIQANFALNTGVEEQSTFTVEATKNNPCLPA